METGQVVEVELVKVRVEIALVEAVKIELEEILKWVVLMAQVLVLV